MPLINPILIPALKLGPPRPLFPELPAVARLKNVLGAWEFHSPNQQLPWKEKKPAGALLGSIVIRKAPAGGRPGQTVVAHVLKRDPTRVYFELRHLGGPVQRPPRYFGPVSTIAIPK